MIFMKATGALAALGILATNKKAGIEPAVHGQIYPEQTAKDY